MTLFDTGIIPAINQHLLDEAAKVRDYGDYWSASSAGYCQRKVIFERLRVPPVNEDPRKQRVFSSGHIFHSWIQAITKETGLSIAQEVELQDEDLMIRGHFDDLVLVKKPAIVSSTEFEMTADNPAMTGVKEFDHLILYDYKTAHSKWFEYVKDRPMSYYNKIQLGTYMYMLRKQTLWSCNHDGMSLKNKSGWCALGCGSDYNRMDKLPELTEARILKISKDDLRLHEQQLLWSDELSSEVRDYWTSLNKYWKEKKLPPCTCADYEKNSKTGIGFMADPRYNPFFFEGEPCSIKWYTKCKEEGLLK